MLQDQRQALSASDLNKVNEMLLTCTKIGKLPLFISTLDSSQFDHFTNSSSKLTLIICILHPQSLKKKIKWKFHKKTGNLEINFDP